MLYTLPVNSFTLINDKDNNIFLVKIADSKKNFFNKSDEEYVKFVKNQNTDNRKSILQSYDQLLNLSLIHISEPTRLLSISYALVWL